MKAWRIILAVAGIALGAFGVFRLVTEIPTHSLLVLGGVAGGCARYPGRDLGSIRGRCRAGCSGGTFPIAGGGICRSR